MNEAIPNYYFYRAADITPNFLKSIGIEAVGIDLDNTTVFDMTFNPLPGVKEWLKSLKDAGLKLVIISNTNNLRARIISREFSIKCFALARKPSPKKILAGLNYTGVSPDKFAFIGDQLFYDIAAANRAGVVSIKVDPTAPEILFASKFRRRREKEREFMELYKDEYPEMRGLNDEY